MGMIVLDARARTECLGFPNAYTLLLPERAVKGKRFPLILCLHDLGQDRWQCMRKANPEEFVEKSGVAVILPDGRRSCFLNMAHGPRWNDYLLQGLIGQACDTFPLEKGRVGVIGTGTGALGALMLARRGVSCALVEPEIRDVTDRDEMRWPREEEWRGVLEERREDWQASHWKKIQGTMTGNKIALDRTETILELFHWKKICCENDSGKAWESALTDLAGRI